MFPFGSKRIACRSATIHAAQLTLFILSNRRANKVEITLFLLSNRCANKVEIKIKEIKIYNS